VNKESAYQTHVTEEGTSNNPQFAEKDKLDKLEEI
jgi:hypothetical protein